VDFLPLGTRRMKLARNDASFRIARAGGLGGYA
jgi:hypothetical protein